MANLIIISGPAGVGKSTISQLLAENLTKSALIEGDTIYNQVVGSYKSAWMEGNHLSLFWSISVNNIQSYINEGYDVIYNYIFNKKSLINMVSKIKCDSIKFVLLMTNEQTLLQRDSYRPEDCQMKERCIKLLNEFKNKNFDIDYILDTTNLTPNDTIKEILSNSRFIIKQRRKV